MYGATYVPLLFVYPLTYTVFGAPVPVEVVPGEYVDLGLP